MSCSRVSPFAKRSARRSAASSSEIRRCDQLGEVAGVGVATVHSISGRIAQRLRQIENRGDHAVKRMGLAILKPFRSRSRCPRRAAWPYCRAWPRFAPGTTPRASPQRALRRDGTARRWRSLDPYRRAQHRTWPRGRFAPGPLSVWSATRTKGSRTQPGSQDPCSWPNPPVG